MPNAIVCRELGPPEGLHLENVPSAPLRPGEVRIEMRAAGLNFPDVLMVEGQYQLKPDLPFTPGMEGAGRVTEIAAGVDGVAVGDRVIVKLRHGCFAEEVVATPAQLAPLPEVFDFAEGATFLAAHGTAYHALVDRAQLKPSEVLLVHGAGGGVGLAAVELGKVLGATVIAVASSAEKLAVAASRGADHTLLSGSEPLRDAVKRLTGGRGADVVFDPVGGTTFEQSLRCIAWGARLLVIGFTGGIGMAATNLVLIKGASVLGVRAGEAARRDPALAAARQAALWRLANDGRLRPHISHRLPLADCAQAMRLLIERRAIGRVVLWMGASSS
ncbi:MAG: NADPH:quinone oxidoreductase family protein [Pseudomonadota bacterium]